MAKLSAGAKRKKKELKRRKKKTIQLSKTSKIVENMHEKLGLPKLSERLIELAGSMLEEGKGDRSFIESTVGMVVMCWNIGTVNESKALEMRESMTEFLVGNVPGGIPEEVEQQIDLIILSRRMIYRDDPRLVMEYKVNWDWTGDYSLQIFSTILAKEERYDYDQEASGGGLSKKSQEGIAEYKVPASEEQAPIAELINEGYNCLDESYAATCDLWLNAWKKIKSLYQDLDSINDIRPFAGILLSYWIGDLDMHLTNAGVDESRYLDIRIQFCREFCEEFPASSPSLIRMMRRAEAESLFFAGKAEQGEQAFERFAESFPDNAWSYIGLGDMYSGENESFDLPIDLNKASRLYQIPIERALEDFDVAIERLEDLHDRQEELGACRTKTIPA
ncbi:MAG: hypothetical protein ACR2PX_24270 [Endozoicomonas sp.]|uniref:hypothetical protein n=1 Tax=Endozoicomonas sp. TaxID=1892382 RepID=UPI003D9B7335